jgi:DNA invertase Pin-like site-specific DNA recombinase
MIKHKVVIEIWQCKRTRAGVKAAQSRGVKFGRKPKLTVQQIGHARKLIAQGAAPPSVAAILRVSARQFTGRLLVDTFQLGKQRICQSIASR